MKIKEIFDLAIKLGIEADFRGKDHIEKNLKKRKEKYENLSAEKKEIFDLPECFFLRKCQRVPRFPG